MKSHEILIKQRRDIIALEKAKSGGGNKRRIELMEMEIVELESRQQRGIKP